MKKIPVNTLLLGVKITQLCVEMVIVFVTVTPGIFKITTDVLQLNKINIQQFSKLSRQPNTLLHIKCGLSTERISPFPTDPTLIVMQMRSLSASKLPLRSSRSSPMSTH